MPAPSETDGSGRRNNPQEQYKNARVSYPAFSRGSQPAINSGRNQIPRLTLWLLDSDPVAGNAQRDQGDLHAT
jgi:hypothetical protein